MPAKSVQLVRLTVFVWWAAGPLPPVVVSVYVCLVSPTPQANGTVARPVVPWYES